jgi:ATP/ADP translocase
LTRRTLGPAQRTKAALLFAWFFLTIATLWLLKPVRTASLLAHLGAAETPYVRLGSVVVVAAVVALYSRAASGLSRRRLMLGVTTLFALVLLAFWLMMRLGGEALGAQRWFVWAVYILVDVYATVMVGVFWTYANDVVTPTEADALYGPVGLGGILGGVAGGVFVDALALPVVGMSFVLAASDHGLNYSLQQSTKETLYVPLRDVQKYKAKAFIDMLVDRAAKALAALALVALIARVGLSVRASMVVSLVALAVWLACAVALGRVYGEMGVRRREPGVRGP